MALPNCANPYCPPGSINLFPCGQCFVCRLKRRQLWQTRITLEASLHSENTFLTLTYDDDHLPSDGSLNLRDYQNFLKRVRKVSPVRYFFVGEYGDESNRPHYHAAIFGLPPTFSFGDFWSSGFVYTGDLTPDSAQYVSGYVVKKMTKSDDPRLNGRQPEFARMSLKPGLGFGAISYIQNNTQSHMPFDVPRMIRLGGRNVPLGKYLVTKSLSERFSDQEIAQIKSDRMSEYSHELLSLLPDQAIPDGGLSKWSASETQGSRESLMSRFHIYSQLSKKL